MTTYFLLRCSTKEQQCALSLHMQLFGLRRYCLRKGIKNAKIGLKYVGSAWSEDSQYFYALEKFITTLKPGDAIFVETPDRFSRNIKKGLEYIKEIHSKGAYVFSWCGEYRSDASPDINSPQEISLLNNFLLLLIGGEGESFTKSWRNKNRLQISDFNDKLREKLLEEQRILKSGWTRSNLTVYNLLTKLKDQVNDSKMDIFFNEKLKTAIDFLQKTIHTNVELNVSNVIEKIKKLSNPFQEISMVRNIHNFYTIWLFRFLLTTGKEQMLKEGKTLEEINSLFEELCKNTQWEFTTMQKYIHLIDLFESYPQFLLGEYNLEDFFKLRTEICNFIQSIGDDREFWTRGYISTSKDLFRILPNTLKRKWES